MSAVAQADLTGDVGERRERRKEAQRRERHRSPGRWVGRTGRHREGTQQEAVFRGGSVGETQCNGKNEEFQTVGSPGSALGGLSGLGRKANEPRRWSERRDNVGAKRMGLRLRSVIYDAKASGRPTSGVCLDSQSTEAIGRGADVCNSPQPQGRTVNETGEHRDDGDDVNRMTTVEAELEESGAEMTLAEWQRTRLAKGKQKAYKVDAIAREVGEPSWVCEVQSESRDVEGVGDRGSSPNLCGRGRLTWAEAVEVQDDLYREGADPVIDACDEGEVSEKAKVINTQLVTMAEMLGLTWNGRKHDAECLFSSIIDRWDKFKGGAELDVDISE